MKINLWFIKFNLSWNIDDLEIKFYGDRYLIAVGAWVHIDWLYKIITRI